MNMPPGVSLRHHSRAGWVRVLSDHLGAHEQMIQPAAQSRIFEQQPPSAVPDPAIGCRSASVCPKLSSPKLNKSGLVDASPAVNQPVHDDILVHPHNSLKTKANDQSIGQIRVALVLSSPRAGLNERFPVPTCLHQVFENRISYGSVRPRPKQAARQETQLPQ
jgi:hypothetical protein